jgi:ribonucleoside-diphosphate reductase alpha chain
MSTNERPPVRESLPVERPSLTKRFNLVYFVDDEMTHERVKQELTFYVQPGMYSDGRIGEVFIRGAKQGGLISGALDAIAMMISIGLQHGIPLQVLTSKLRHHQFGPGGLTGDPEFRTCSSMFDLIAQYLDSRFPGGVYLGQRVANADLPEGGQNSTSGNGTSTP